MQDSEKHMVEEEAIVAGSLLWRSCYKESFFASVVKISKFYNPTAAAWSSRMAIENYSYKVHPSCNTHFNVADGKNGAHTNEKSCCSGVCIPTQGRHYTFSCSRWYRIVFSLYTPHLGSRHLSLLSYTGID